MGLMSDWTKKKTNIKYSNKYGGSKKREGTENSKIDETFFLKMF